MIKTFFKTTFRYFLKNKTYSLLNIFGLAIGLAVTCLIFLWVEDEVNFDNNNLKKDRIYMCMNNWPYEGNYSTFRSTPGQLGPAIKAEITGVANTCRKTDGKRTVLIQVGERTMYSPGNFADSSLFSIFTIPFVQGNAKDAFKDLYSLVITEKTSKKFFGDDKSVVGRTVKVDNQQDYTITGVIKDLPENSSLQFEWIAPFEVYYKDNHYLDNWNNNNPITYVELNKNASLDAVNKQLYGIIKKRVPATIVSTWLFSMNDWHLRNDFENGKLTGRGRIQYVRMFTLIACIILFLACINFMNLATARSEKRAREVGVRKVLGSRKRALVYQFLGEALTMAALAVLISTLITFLVLPAFNLLTKKELSLGLNNPWHIAFLVVVSLTCGLVAGSYPSLYLSSFNPVSVLKGLKLKAGSAGFIRKGLVILQFTISVVLIIGTIIIYQQIQHVKSRELGFNKSNLLVMDMKGDMAKNYTLIKQDLLNTGVVENVGLTDHETIYGGNNTSGFSWEGKNPNAQILVSVRGVSPEFLSTCDIKLIAGRQFNSNPAIDSQNVIITESMAKVMNMKEVLGAYIRDGDSKLQVVGIVKDFMYGNMYGTPTPLLFYAQANYERESNMYVRIKNHTDLEQVIAKIGAVIKKDNSVFPFDYRFVDDEFDRLFLNEMLVSKLSRIFAALAIIISCLGLFGLAAYTAERRIREIGIRKVLGATISGLTGLLVKDFLKLVLVSCLLAFPIGWWAMHSWLQNYQYRIDISWWVFLLAGSVAALIALFTISYQAIKAALMSPVKSLKTE